MRHEHLARALVELMEIGKTPSGADPVLHHAPKAFDGVEVVPTMGWEAMEAQRAVVVVEGRVELMRPMDPAAIDDHHDLFVRFAAGRHHLMQILAQLLSITVRHNFREDFGGPVLDRPYDTQQHAARHTVPRAIRQPCLAFETLVALDLTLAQRARGQATALGFAPPTGPRQGKTPQDRFILIKKNHLAPAGLVLQRGEGERGISEVSGLGREPPRGTAVAYVFFFNTSRMLSRLSWTPVWRAS